MRFCVTLLHQRCFCKVVAKQMYVNFRAKILSHSCCRYSNRLSHCNLSRAQLCFLGDSTLSKSIHTTQQSQLIFISKKMYKKQLIAENKNKFFIYLFCFGCIVSRKKFIIFSESTRIHKCDDTHCDLILKTKICPPYKVNAEEMAIKKKRTVH